MMRAYLMKLADNAYRECTENSVALTPRFPGGKLLDLGCDDGELTVRLASRSGARGIHGVEISDRGNLARKKGVRVKRADLNRRLPYAAAMFDLVHANQVIEHLFRIDQFLSEVHRVLRPGGFAVIGTENLSSWHNIAATMAGFQPFSSSNISRKVSGVGNPWALHSGRRSERDTSWMHVTLLAYRGLSDFLGLYGLRVLATRGAGYYPFPGWLARLDPRHSVYIHVLARKDPPTLPGGPPL